MPRLLGKSVSMSCYVDADHAGCQVTRRSHSGVIIFCESGTNFVVLEETDYRGNFDVWVGDCCVTDCD
jgi:hypothetical protein